MASLSQAGLDRLHEAMALRVEHKELPGMVTLVADGDEVAVDTIGSVAFESTELMRRDTIFRIASMTKPVVSAVTMMLVEDGTLNLADPVDGLLPEMADRRVLARIDAPLDETVPARRPITIEDLLTFRMGHGIIVEPTFDPTYPITARARELRLTLTEPDPRTPHEPDEWIRLFGSLPLMYQPGERWQYNTGTLVLGVLLARAAGTDLADLLRTRVFEPLGMAETGFWIPEDDAGRLPRCYATNFETGVLEESTLPSAEIWVKPPAFPSGSGGLASTVDDFLIFVRFLMNKGVHNGNRLLTEASVEQMTTNHLTADQMRINDPILAGHGWGYAMAVVTEPDSGSPVPGRYGWAGGYGTAWFNHPGTGRIGIAMTQTSDFLFNGGATEFETLALAA
jgi:CubicO group peptidase (beta-lactamase class C family)